MGCRCHCCRTTRQATFANINAAERMFWRNTIIPEMKFLEDHLNEKLLPILGHSKLRTKFDLSELEALRENENSRVERESILLDRGVLTINEVRRQRNLPDVPWGDEPFLEATRRSRFSDEGLRSEMPPIFKAEKSGGR